MASRKGKRRNSEKRKEKSRDAARCRRNKESDVFSDLAGLLPLPMSQTLQQDKASIIRLAISHLRLRKLLGTDMTSGDYSDSVQKKLDMQYSKALEGFVLILSQEGDIVYLSESVSRYLGLTQLDLIGHSIYEFTYPCDHDEIREVLAEKSPSDGSSAERKFLIRMKCTITSKGRSINLKSATYKVIQCSGRYVTAGSGSRHLLGLLDNQDLSCLLLICEPIAHPANIEVPLDSSTFVSKHSLAMRFTYCDDRISQLLGYRSDDILNQSVFDFHHALDTEIIKDACKSLFSKGQAVIGKYRFLARGGGYCWVQTEATVIMHQRTDKAQSIVCVNYILSGVEEKDLVLSQVQTMTRADALPAPTVLTPRQNTLSSPPPTSQPQDTPAVPSSMVLSTESIFAPLPQDADMDMLRITDIDGKVSILDDLTQLAPSAGSAMTPLNFMNDSREELFNDVDMMSNMYNNSAEDLLSGGSVVVDSNSSDTPSTSTDVGMLDLSFLICDGSAAAAAFALSEKNTAKPATLLSTEPQLTHLDDTLQACLKTELSDDFDDVDFDLRAPYIPMDGLDDKLLDASWVPLVDEDQENSKMLGTTESVFASKPPEDMDDTDNRKVPMSVLRLQAANKMLGVSVGDIERNDGPPKIKRPMETNRLETGPPKPKASKMNVEQDCKQHSTTGTIPGASLGKMVADPRPYTIKATPSTDDQNAITGSSVLKNLLTQGKDINYGYEITTTRPLKQVLYGVKHSTCLRSLLQGDLSTSDDEYLETDSSEDDVMFVSSPESSKVPTPRQSIVRRILPKLATVAQQSGLERQNTLGDGAMLVTLLPSAYQGLRSPQLVSLARGVLK